MCITSSTTSSHRPAHDMANHYETHHDTQDPHKDSDYLSSVLFNLLLQMTQRQTMIFKLMHIVLQNFDDHRFVQQLSKWEFYISRYELLRQDDQIAENNSTDYEG